MTGTPAESRRPLTPRRIRRAVGRRVDAAAAKTLAWTAKPFGLRVEPRGLGYFDPDDVVPAARAAGLSLCEFLESTNRAGVGRRRDLIIDRLRTLGAFDGLGTVLEIGAGTGMYLERTLDHGRPKRYEVYETATKWRQYLGQAYAGRCELLLHEADGATLSATGTQTCDLVAAHGVFVYLPTLTTMRYLDEAVRACRIGGTIVFDVFADKRFDLATLRHWQQAEPGQTFPVITPCALLEDWTRAQGLVLVDTFDVPYHAARSTYFVLRRES
jgi:phospholipid N-methyltransferase